MIVPGNIIHNRKKLEIIQMFIKWWLNKQNVMHPHSVINVIQQWKEIKYW